MVLHVNWDSETYGFVNGTIQCADGHVLLPRVPSDLRTLFEGLFWQAFGETRPHVAEACSYLDALGHERAEHNGHIAYGHVRTREAIPWVRAEPEAEDAEPVAPQEEVGTPQDPDTTPEPEPEAEDAPAPTPTRRQR